MVHFSNEKPSFRNKKGYSYVIFHDTGEERYCKKAYTSISNALSGISHCSLPCVRRIKRYFKKEDVFSVIANALLGVKRDNTGEDVLFAVYDIESGKVLKHASFVSIEVDNYHYYKLESSDPEEELFV